MRILIRHLGSVISRTQERHSGGIQTDPPRIGRAAIVQANRTLVEWPGESLEAYLRDTKQLAILYDGDRGDGWHSSWIKGWRRESTHCRVATASSRYTVQLA